MEFAVSALVLLVLLLPGFILQTSYTKGFWRWNSPTSARPLTEQIPGGIVTASILHLIWTSVCAWLGHHIDLSALTMFLLSSYGHDDEFFKTTLASITHHPYKVFIYFISLYLGSALLGYLSHYLVRRYKLDRRTRILRFNNEWFYLLSGEITEFVEYPEDLGKVDGVYLTTIVHHSGKDYLYRGIVADFFFDKSGNLDRVLLTLAHRRPLLADREAGREFDHDEIDDRYYSIEGDYFILRYSEMSTINLDYFFIEEEGSQTRAA